MECPGCAGLIDGERSNALVRSGLFGGSLGLQAKVSEVERMGLQAWSWSGIEVGGYT